MLFLLSAHEATTAEIRRHEQSLDAFDRENPKSGAFIWCYKRAYGQHYAESLSDVYELYHGQKMVSERQSVYAAWVQPLAPSEISIIANYTADGWVRN